ncbi:PREDICTED: uncharacterized protein K02A2.6-like [Rhagoletis zephyria]|uniref:uncharacterized protein K02A2.6-like n=1 Tax=Rhagoletis zephyria TaxID=28612 RepID=UPI0008118D00|nr:PREDICTED: uncharacterized protein K02A2.6-like [Rhagoletis zephyria]
MYIVRSDRQPLLGREWLREIDIDWKNITENQLKERTTVNVLSSGSAEVKLQNILRKFPLLSALNVGTITGHQERLYLKENAVPKFIRAWRVPFPLMKAVENEIDKQVREGLLVKVDKSEWATPTVAVPKRDGTVRICGDYKLTVNPALIVDEHPLPTIDELFSSMAGGEKFTKIDLAKAYLQLEIHPDNRELLTLSTHKGLFQPTRMMFGIASAPAKWQRFMEQLLGDIAGVKVFLDDIKITARDDVTHLQRIEEVHLEKSEFLRDKIEYCGYEISKMGIRKQKTKVEAIQDMKQPSTKNERIKEMMQTDTVLTRYDPQLPPTGVGAVFKPHFSGRYRKANSVCLANTKRCLTVIQSVTDNKAIAQIFSPHKGLPTLSAMRTQHYAIFLESFDYVVRVKSSKANANADAMSRLATQKRDCFVEEVDVITAQLIDNLPVTAEDLGAATAKEPEVKILVDCLKYGRDCEAKQRFGIPQ